MKTTSSQPEPVLVVSSFQNQAPAGDSQQSISRPSPTACRLFVAIITLSLTVGLLAGYFALISHDGIQWLEWLALPLFVLLSSWIAFSFGVAMLGAWHWHPGQKRSCEESSKKVARKLRADGDSAKCESLSPVTITGPPTTAILVPIYNESPQDVLARVEAMALSLDRLGHAKRFAFFVLSDSTNPDAWLSEEVGWSALAQRLQNVASIFYRHRNRNISRKSGNIADFVERWGSSYQFMIVLDADSLMSGEAMCAMVDRMQEDTKLGILQIGPRPIGRRSVLARMQQFSSAAYGPLFNVGFAAWAGDQGNYWGHNAIIRVSAFLQCCDLPVLPGKAPLGGEILSHDFVEAALMVRRGWKVVLATDLDGSYEECPTTLSDYAQRDQRWCQGNLQHSRLMISEGFHPASRLHFLGGIMGYVSSPVWLLLMALSLLGFAAAPDSDVPTSWWTQNGHWVLFLSMFSMLLMPKLLSYLGIVVNGQASKFGGAFRLAVSMCLEMLWSILIAPVIGLLHTRFVVGILTGKTVKWNAQQRCERGVPLSAAWSDYGWITLVGAVILMGLMLTDTPLWLWFLPITLGWILAVPLAMICGSLPAGQWLLRHRLLVVSEDLSPPNVVQDFEQASRRVQDESVASHDWFELMLTSEEFLTLHDQILSQTGAVVELSEAQRSDVMAMAKQGTDQIPVTLRRDVLKDPELMHRLHLQQAVLNQMAL